MSDDLLNWTITHAPDLDEPSPEPEKPTAPAHPAQTHHKISRVTWLILGSLMLTSVATLTAFTLGNHGRIQREVRQVVREEEQAAVAGDVARLTPLIDAGDPRWAAAQTRWAQNRQAAPLPLGPLYAVREAGEIQSVENFTADVVRVDVAHQFIAPDQASLTFILPQFYRYADGQWKRRPPPAAYWGEASQYHGSHLDISYYTVDAAFVEKDLAPYLDEALAKACAAWACPVDLRFSLYFTADLPPNGYADVATETWPRDAPLLFNLLAASRTEWQSNTALLLPLPHLTGYPADERSKYFYRRALALQVLTQAAVQLTRYQAFDQTHNAFLYALAARMGVQLGLEPPQVRTSLPGSRFNAALLWDWRQVESSRAALTPGERGEILEGALSVLNQLLAGQPVEAEIRLLHGLRSKRGGPVEWLSAGLGLSPGDTRRRLFDAVADAYRLRVTNPTIYEFVLGCETGALLGARYTAEPEPLFAEDYADALITSWSPDGRRLMVALPNHLAVVDFDSRRVTPLPDEFLTLQGQEIWASNTVVAYPTLSNQAPGEFDPAQYELKFFDTANAAWLPASLTGVPEYVPSPDRTMAAVVRFDDDPNNPEIALTSALGGPLTPVDDGLSPAWSPDGQALAYVQPDTQGTSAALRLAEVTPPGMYPVKAGDTLTGIAARFNLSVEALLAANSLPDPNSIFAGQRLVIPGSTTTFAPPTYELLSPAALSGFPYLSQPVWSPRGDLVAFVAWNDARDWFTLGLVRPDGRWRSTLELSAINLEQLAFSADGNYLAFVLWGHPGGLAPQTVIYNTANGASLTLNNTRAYTWISKGHAIVTLAGDGLYYITEPGSRRVQPIKLSDQRCSDILWNPIR